jgi:alpha-glucoside transport system substrate-binding protein
VYDRWVAHEIPFNDPEVLEAAEVVSQIMFTEGYVYGGNTGINTIWVGDTQTPMFAEDGPKCWLHKQAAWITDFWPGAQEGDPQFEAGTDSAFFYLPPIEEEFGSPALGAGDMFVMFDDRPEVRAVMEYLATPEAAQGWIEAGAGFVAANSSVPTDWYTTYKDQAMAEILTQSTALRFDASDTMPAEVGGGTFLSGMVDWVAAGGDGTEEIFQSIEESWPSG